MIRRIYKFIWHAIKQHPLASTLCFMLLLALLAIQIRESFPGLPSDWNARNLPRIALSDTNNYYFAVFGDNKNSHKPFNHLLDKIDADPEISFAIDVGDLVFDGAPEKFHCFLRQVHHHLHKPLLTAIGNHDIADHGRGPYSEIFGPFYYTFRLGKTAFVVLDDANEQGIDLWQRSWLKQTLGQAQKDNCQILVFMHVPPIDPRGGIYDHGLQNRKSAVDLLSLLRQYGVAHVFCSHIHGFFQGEWNGLPYTITGGGGAELAGGTDENHYFYHYLKVHVTNGKLDIEVCRMPSPGAEWLDRIGSMAWLYIYAFLYMYGLETFLLLLVLFLLSVIFSRSEKL